LGAAAGNLTLTRPDKVPTIAGDVEEYRDATIRLVARRSHELYPRCDHFLELTSEVVDAQKEPDATGELISNDCRLFSAVRASEQ
jgi:hypothetical protein